MQAGTATIARVLAEKINENAAPFDRVTPEELRQRALEHTGEKIRKSICSNGTNRIARQSAERQLDLENPSAPIPEPVIDWGKTLTSPGNKKGVVNFGEFLFSPEPKNPCNIGTLGANRTRDTRIRNPRLS